MMIMINKRKAIVSKNGGTLMKAKRADNLHYIFSETPQMANIIDELNCRIGHLNKYDLKILYTELISTKM